jgi:hypothetical protein
VIGQLGFRDDGVLAGRVPVPRVPSALAAVTIVAGVAAPVLAVLAPALVPATITVGVLTGLATRRPRRPDGLAWLIPPSLRAVEYGAILALAWGGPDPAPMLGFALLWALAYHHYDAVYRSRARRELPPPWLVAALGGWEGRLLLVAVASAAGVLVPALAALTAWCAVLGVGESVAFWRSADVSAEVEEL